MKAAAVTGTDLLPVVARLVRLLRNPQPPDGLSSVATAVLSRLQREGPQRLTDLARSEAVSQPGMTQLVGRLERDELVRRAADAHDGRVVLIEITKGGRTSLARTEAGYAARLDALLAALAEGDRAALAAALPALRRLVQHGPTNDR